MVLENIFLKQAPMRPNIHMSSVNSWGSLVLCCTETSRVLKPSSGDAVCMSAELPSSLASQVPGCVAELPLEARMVPNAQTWVAMQEHFVLQCP